MSFQLIYDLKTIFTAFNIKVVNVKYHHIIQNARFKKNISFISRYKMLRLKIATEYFLRNGVLECGRHQHNVDSK